MPWVDVASSKNSAADRRKRTLITGASGNLGSEVARQLAQPGVRLSLWGRNESRLNSLAQSCIAAGAVVDVCALDLTDTVAAVERLGTEDDAEPFGTVLLIAGQGDTLPDGRFAECAGQVIRVSLANFVAPAAMAAEIAERMALRGGGRIGLVGSAAAWHSLPFAASYAASKAGLARFADALRLGVRDRGVTVTLVAPGFFAPSDPLTAAPRLGEIPSSVVAARLIAAIDKGAPELVTPWPFVALRIFGTVLPRPLRDRLLLSLPRP